MIKKLAFLIRDLDYGGAQRQLVTLAKGLDKQGFDITVLYFYPGGPLAKDLSDHGIATICLEKQQRWDVFSFFSRLIGHLKRIQPDVLHSYLGEANILALFLKVFFPDLQVIWGIRESNTNPDLHGWLGRLIFQLEILFSQFTDLIIVNSHAGRAHHEAHGFANHKMMVIPNGIDTERFHPDPDAGTAVRAEWGVAQTTPLIGLVGRFDPMKDHPTFLRAVALLCQERSDVQCVCVGTGPQSYAEELYQLAAELGVAERVIWAGARSDMPAVYNAIDLLVSASSNGEGFANVIGEAMACGVPCVVTDVGDSAEIVGEVGIVVPSQQPEALKDAISRMIDSADRDDGDRAVIRNRILIHFSLAQLIHKTETALLSL